MALSHSDVYALGYPRVIPISPATKIPGELRNGAWGGLKGWSKDAYDETRRKAWTAMGASVGLLPGDHVMGFDADTLDPALAEIICEEIERIAPDCPVRVGRAPKALYLVRLSAPLRLKDLKFGDQREALEFRTGLRQVVLAGQHEKTGKPYFWTRPLVPFDQLPIVTPEQVLAMAARLAERLPDAEKPKLAGSGEAKDQRALRGDPERVAKTVAVMKNGPKLGWHDFVEMVCALRGAMPDDLDRAEGLFLDWCDRWEGGTADLDVSRKAWDSIRPPVRIGANWLYEKAAEWSGGTRNVAHGPFDDLGDEIPSLFTAPESEPSETFQPIKWVDPASWEGASPRPREWEVMHWIPKGEVTLIYGDGGIGKTLVAHQYATCAAAGLNWLDQETRKARVMCFFCEDSEDELMRRQIDINRSMGVTMAVLSASLRIASRKYMDNLLALWDRNTGAMKRQAVWEELLRDAKAFKADVLVIDTIADTYGGSEIDRGQVNAFVKSCLGRLAQEIGGSVIALGHPSMAGKASGSGTSGSTAWSNAARSRLFLRYPKGVDAGNIREMEGMKSNYGPKGALLKLRWNAGAFDVLASNMPNAAATAPTALSASSVEARAEPISAATFGLGGRSVEGAAIDAVLAALRACSGVALNMKPNSPAYAPKVLKSREADLLAAFDKDDVEKAMRRIEKEGGLSVVEVGRTATRHPITGYAVKDKLSISDAATPDIFG